MKKILVFLFMCAINYTSDAQDIQTAGAYSNDSVASSNDRISSEKSKSIEERLTRQEEEMKSLKKDNELLKQQVNRLKTASNISSNSRVTISRRGSKQVSFE